MADGSKIEWTDATWNVVIGCDKVSPGCDHCYAIRTAHRFQEHPNPAVAAAYAGTEQGGDWTGRVNLVESRLDLPLRWKRPRRIFVNAQSDLFHDQVPDEFIARVWAVMALAPQHTFQVLTKRHGRMRSLLSRLAFRSHVNDKAWLMLSGEDSLRDQCEVAGVPFLFKQWGSHRPSAVGSIVRGGVRFPMVPASKTAAGRELDGRTWDEYPQAVSHA